MKLCDNPRCPRHCDVVQDEHGWRYVNGFQNRISKEDLKSFDLTRKVNLCQVCSGPVLDLETALRNLRDASRSLIEITQNLPHDTRFKEAEQKVVDSIKESEKVLPPIGLSTTMRT